MYATLAAGLVQQGVLWTGHSAPVAGWAAWAAFQTAAALLLYLLVRKC